MSLDHKCFGYRPKDIKKLQDSEGGSYVLEELTSNSKKASMPWCGKVPFGGAEVSIGRTFMVTFNLP